MTKKLSYAALDVKVKEIRQLVNKDVLCEPKSEDESLCAQTLSISLNDLGISEDVSQRLLELKKKNIDMNALLKEALEKREVELAEEKSVIEAEIEQQEELRQMYLERVIADEENSLELAKRSRYVPAKVRKVLTKEFGDRCSAQGCGRKAVELHNERQFSKGGITITE